MALTITCPACGRQLALDEQHRGWQVRCPNCQTEFAAEGDPEPPPRPPARGYDRRPPGYDRPPPVLGHDGHWYGDLDAVRAEAAVKVGPPAVCLMLAAGLGLGYWCLVLLTVVVDVVNPNAVGRNDPAAQVGRLMALGVSFVWSVVVFFGGLFMKQLRSRSSVTVACVWAMLPCNLGCLLGIPFGIWGLVVLNDPAVRLAFDRPPGGRRGEPEY